MTLIVSTPIGAMKAPDNIARSFSEMSDQELFESVYWRGFVEPFALAEIQRRGKLTKFYEWKGLL